MLWKHEKRREDDYAPQPLWISYGDISTMSLHLSLTFPPLTHSLAHPPSLLIHIYLRTLRIAH